MGIQSVLFDRSTWTPSQAKKWLNRYKAKTTLDIPKTGGYIRARQSPPTKFKKGSFRTVPVTSAKESGIKFVYACPKHPLTRGNPMPTLLALNPRGARKQKKQASKKKGPKMATKKHHKKGKKSHHKKRHNPSAKYYAKRAYHAARTRLAGIDFKSALKVTIPMLLGAITGKFFAKRFTTGGGELENWGWKNYLLCLGGGGVAAVVSRVIFRLSDQTTQQVFLGAAFLTAYKLFTLELAPKNTTLSEWFGGYQGLGQNNALPDYAQDMTEVGQIWEGGQESYAKGIDGYYRPLDESHRLPEVAGYGDDVVPASGRMGDVVVAAGSRMGDDAGDMASRIAKEFQMAY